MSSESLIDIKLFLACVNFAAIKHKDQRRMDADKTPYINHPIGEETYLLLFYNVFHNNFSKFRIAGVAHILTSEGGITDAEVIQAALLHDTVEDTDTSFDEIEQHFGPNVRKIVEEVTDDKSLPKMERKRLQIVHAAHSSYKAKLVKLADKLYNLRDLQRCAPQEWTQVLVANILRNFGVAANWRAFLCISRIVWRNIIYGQNRLWTTCETRIKH